MKKRVFVVAALLVGSTLTVFPSTSHADTSLNLGSIEVKKLDEGYDDPSELFGENFDCVVAGTNTTHKMDRTWFESIMNNISAQQSQYSANPSGGWNPVSPPDRNCKFKHTLTETKKTSTFVVSHPTYGNGKLTTTCDMNFSMDVSFDYQMVVPTSIPGMTGVLPVTSASDWLTKFGGTRKCSWSIIFGRASTGGVSADDRLVGTIDQDFTTLDEAKPEVSVNCKSFPKTLCVAYTYTSKISVSSGEGKFAGVQAGEGTQTDTRMLPSALINMPFEVDGDNATVIQQSLNKNARYPRLKIAGVSASAVKLKSVINMKVTKRSLTVTAKKSTSAKSIAVIAKLKVLSTSKVSLKVASASSKNCKVVRSSLRGLKAGNCRVAVTVKPRKGRAVTRVVTVKIRK